VRLWGWCGGLLNEQVLPGKKARTRLDRPILKPSLRSGGQRSRSRAEEGESKGRRLRKDKGEGEREGEEGLLEEGRRGKEGEVVAGEAEAEAEGG